MKLSLWYQFVFHVIIQCMQNRGNLDFAAFVDSIDEQWQSQEATMALVCTT